MPRGYRIDLGATRCKTKGTELNFMLTVFIVLCFCCILGLDQGESLI